MLGNRVCHRLDRRLGEWIDGALAPDTAERVEAHIAECASCRRKAQRLQHTAGLVREYGEQADAGAPDDWVALRARLVARVAAPRRLPLQIGTLRRAVAWGGLFAAVAAALVLVILKPWNRHDTSTAVGRGEPTGGVQRDVAVEPTHHGSPSGGVNSTDNTDQTPSPTGVTTHENASAFVVGRSSLVGGRAVSRPLPPPRFGPRSPSDKSAVVPDVQYLDGHDPQLAAFWIDGAKPSDQPSVDSQLPPVRDDFVRVPWQQIAGRDSRAIEAARRAYQQEADIVDPRLFRKVALHEKGTSLEDLCAKLEKQTGVKLSASRGIRDEKASVFVNELPARDVMREVARLFDAYWVRSGAQGAYEYDLKQDLKTQLGEEELRNRDIDAALLALDEAIVANPKDTPARQAYLQLTPAERMALRSGKEIRFSTDEALPAGFPEGWAHSVLKSWGTFTLPNGTFTPADNPGFVAAITLILNHSELGQVSLDCECDVRGPNLPGIGSNESLGTGRSPSAARPDNRTANKALESDAAFGREVSLAPTPCSKPDWKTAFGVDFSKIRYIEDDIQDGVSPPTPHVNSADVWEAVHDATGMPIIADYYTHLYKAGDFTMKKRRLFDALCQVGDALGMHWKRDGEILLCRSTSFFWDKVKEVPNRLLDRWQRDREQNDALPLDDLLEMATLTDQQLDSLFVGQGIKHCRGLMEWNILSDPEYAGVRRKYDTVRPMARFLASLPRSLRAQALTKDGVPASALNPAQQEAFSRIVPIYVKPASYEGMRFQVVYVPSRRYYWGIVVNSGAEEEKWLANPPIVTGKTPEETIAAARQIYPDIRPEDIRRSHGQLAMSFLYADGTASSIGKRPPAVRIKQ